MANMLFYAHSGLRFLVLLAAAIAIVALLWGWSSRRPFAGASRVAATVFTRLLGVQVLLGIVLVMLRPWYGALIGHLVMMVAAIGAAEAITGFGRRQEDPRKAHMISLIGVVLALLLIVGGIMAIRPSPFFMSGGN